MQMKRGILAFLAAVMLMMPVFATNLHASGLRVEIDGAQVQFEVPPFIHEGRTMVPVRAIAEMLDVEVLWHQETGTVTYYNHHSGMRFELMIGRGYALEIDSAGANEVDLDVPPMIVDGRTFVPLRFIAESLDIEVDFADGTVLLVTAASADSAAQPAPIAWEDLSQTVWIAGTGGLIYHQVDNCGNMNPARATSMTRGEARDEGIRACLRCW
jgi:hypothetical protein